MNSTQLINLTTINHTHLATSSHQFQPNTRHLMAFALIPINFSQNLIFQLETFNLTPTSMVLFVSTKDIFFLPIVPA
jgi:hypothetical protein